MAPPQLAAAQASPLQVPAARDPPQEGEALAGARGRVLPAWRVALAQQVQLEAVQASLLPAVAQPV